MQNQEKMYFAAILPSPRSTFPMDMSDEEKQIMSKHAEFWQKLFDYGQGVITGPVLDPKGAFGFGVLVADSIETAQTLLENDPAQKISRYEIYQMLASVPNDSK